VVVAAAVAGAGVGGEPGERRLGAPEPLPGTGTDVAITSLSCWSAGNCAVGGSYLPAPGRWLEPFTASEAKRRWSAPEPVPGITALNKHGSYINPSSVAAVSCPSAAHCTADGSYLTDRKIGDLSGARGSAGGAGWVWLAGVGGLSVMRPG
jgi:hypothetical protein